MSIEEQIRIEQEQAQIFKVEMEAITAGIDEQKRKSEEKAAAALKRHQEAEARLVALEEWLKNHG